MPNAELQKYKSFARALESLPALSAQIELAVEEMISELCWLRGAPPQQRGSFSNVESLLEQARANHTMS